MSNFPWPLPLVAFEEYMLRDDRPQYPMNIIARLRFSGQLDRAAAQEAVEAVLARHPLLRAKVRKTPSGRLEWIAATDCPVEFSSIDGPPIDRLPSMRPIDLYSEAGFRAWITADSQGSSLAVQVHHAVCDGKAVLQLLDEFVRSYARVRAGPQSTVKPSALELPACDPQSLRRRGNFGLTLGSYLRMLPAQLMGLSRVWKFFVHRPVALLKPVAAISSSAPAGFPAVRVGRLEADEVRKLSAAVAAAKVTANDWLLRDFFRAVDEFRALHESAARGGWVRVSVPISLRHGTGHRMPAANAVSMVFLDRKPQQIVDPAGLLRGIHEEMETIRRRQLGLIFIVALWVVRRLPGGLAKWVNRDCCEATCVLSNVGRAMAESPLPRCDEKIVADNLVLDGIDFFAPVRAGTAVSVALMYYAGGLQLCMHYDSGQITELQADDLLATYLRTIRASLNMGSGTVRERAA